MAKKKTSEAPRRDKIGDPINGAAIMDDIRRYLMTEESAQPKKTAKAKKLKEKPAETQRWDENGDPTNDAAVLVDIRRYLMRP